jgi:hypothetical protein
MLAAGELFATSACGGTTTVPSGVAQVSTAGATGKILDTKTLDNNKTADVFGLLATGTSDSDTVLFYTDIATNTLQELER